MSLTELLNALENSVPYKNEKQVISLLYACLSTITYSYPTVTYNSDFSRTLEKLIVGIKDLPSYSLLLPLSELIRLNLNQPGELDIINAFILKWFPLVLGMPTLKPLNSVYSLNLGNYYDETLVSKCVEHVKTCLIFMKLIHWTILEAEYSVIMQLSNMIIQVFDHFSTQVKASAINISLYLILDLTGKFIDSSLIHDLPGLSDKYDNRVTNGYDEIIKKFENIWYERILYWLLDNDDGLCVVGYEALEVLFTVQHDPKSFPYGSEKPDRDFLQLSNLVKERIDVFSNKLIEVLLPHLETLIVRFKGISLTQSSVCIFPLFRLLKESLGESIVFNTHPKGQTTSTIPKFVDSEQKSFSNVEMVINLINKYFKPLLKSFDPFIVVEVGTYMFEVYDMLSIRSIPILPDWPSDIISSYIPLIQGSGERYTTNSVFMIRGWSIAPLINQVVNHIRAVHPYSFQVQVILDLLPSIATLPTFSERLWPLGALMQAVLQPAIPSQLPELNLPLTFGDDSTAKCLVGDDPILAQPRKNWEQLFQSPWFRTLWEVVDEPEITPISIDKSIKKLPRRRSLVGFGKTALATSSSKSTVNEDKLKATNGVNNNNIQRGYLPEGNYGKERSIEMTTLREEALLAVCSACLPMIETYLGSLGFSNEDKNNTKLYRMYAVFSSIQTPPFKENNTGYISEDPDLMASRLETILSVLERAVSCLGWKGKSSEAQNAYLQLLYSACALCAEAPFPEKLSEDLDGFQMGNTAIDGHILKEDLNLCQMRLRLQKLLSRRFIKNVEQCFDSGLQALSLFVFSSFKLFSSKKAFLNRSVEESIIRIFVNVFSQSKTKTTKVENLMKEAQNGDLYDLTSSSKTNNDSNTDNLPLTLLTMERLASILSKETVNKMVEIIEICENQSGDIVAKDNLDETLGVLRSLLRDHSSIQKSETGKIILSQQLIPFVEKSNIFSLSRILSLRMTSLLIINAKLLSTLASTHFMRGLQEGEMENIQQFPNSDLSSMFKSIIKSKDKDKTTKISEYIATPKFETLTGSSDMISIKAKHIIDYHRQRILLFVEATNESELTLEEVVLRVDPSGSLDFPQINTEQCLKRVHLFGSHTTINFLSWFLIRSIDPTNAFNITITMKSPEIKKSKLIDEGHLTRVRGRRNLKLSALPYLLSLDQFLIPAKWYTVYAFQKHWNSVFQYGFILLARGGTSDSSVNPNEAAMETLNSLKRKPVYVVIDHSFINGGARCIYCATETWMGDVIGVGVNLASPLLPGDKSPTSPWSWDFRIEIRTNNPMLLELIFELRYHWVEYLFDGLLVIVDPNNKNTKNHSFMSVDNKLVKIGSSVPKVENFLRSWKAIKESKNDLALLQAPILPFEDGNAT